MTSQDAQRLQQLEDSQAARVCISDYMRLCDQLDSPETVQASGATTRTRSPGSARMPAPASSSCASAGCPSTRA